MDVWPIDLMLKLPDKDSLITEVKKAMRAAPAQEALRDIYVRLQSEIETRKPLCVASGKCCHFDSYGHRLYVTTLELAVFMTDFQNRSNGLKLDETAGLQTAHPGSGAQLRTGVETRLYVLPLSSDGCRFQIDKLCSVHAIRPFGCRIFFCDPAAADWQQQQYELFHAEIRNLHRKFEVNYFYVEWRQALAALLPDFKPTESVPPV